TFEGPGDVYVKLLPNGDPVQVTHDSASGKEGPVAFSPDGSRIAFTDGYSGGGTWTAPVLGGEPDRRMISDRVLRNIQGTFIGAPKVMLFIENDGKHCWFIGEGIVVVADVPEPDAPFECKCYSPMRDFGSVSVKWSIQRAGGAAAEMTVKIELAAGGHEELCAKSV